MTGWRERVRQGCWAAMVERGEVTSVIDSTYPLSRTPDAVRHLETGQPRGKVVVTVAAAP